MNSRKIFLQFIFAFGLVWSLPEMAYSDSVSTSGEAHGGSSGRSDRSSYSSFDAGGSSKAYSSQSDHNSGRSESWVVSGVIQQSSQGDNEVGVAAAAGASANSHKKKSTASAAAATTGQTNDLASDASVQAASQSSDGNYQAAATGSNGASALANGGTTISVSTNVPNGVTQTGNNRKGYYSITMAPDGSYALATASVTSATATVGVTSVRSLSAASISQMIQSVLYATATASYDQISASASASINGAASNLAAQASASGYSSASAKVTFDRRRGLATITLSSNARCGDNSKTWNARQIECRTFRKTIKISGVGHNKLPMMSGIKSSLVQSGISHTSFYGQKVQLVKVHAKKVHHTMKAKHIKVKKHKKHFQHASLKLNRKPRFHA